MFSKSGWISVPDVWNIIYKRRALLPESISLSFRDFITEVDQDFDAFIGSQSSAKVFFQNGQEFDAGKDFITGYSAKDRNIYPFFSIASGLTHDFHKVEYRAAIYLRKRSLSGYLASLGIDSTRAIQVGALVLSLGVYIFAALILWAVWEHVGNSFLGLLEHMKSSGPKGGFFLRILFYYLIIVPLIWTAMVGIWFRPSQYIEAGKIGDFAGGIVCFASAELDSFIDMQTQEVGMSNGTVAEEKRVKDLIIGSLDRNESFTKKEAQDRFGQELGMRGFDRAWASARSERPELGRPGRRNKGDI